MESAAAVVERTALVKSLGGRLLGKKYSTGTAYVYKYLESQHSKKSVYKPETDFCVSRELDTQQEAFV